MDSLIAKIKTNPETVIIRLNATKEWISNLEGKIMEITQPEHQTGRQMNWKQHIRSTG